VRKDHPQWPDVGNTKKKASRPFKKVARLISNWGDEP